MRGQHLDCLVVEDSPTQALQLVELLRTNGYKTDVVKNGREAMDFLASKKPAIIISDIIMPEMNGYDLCRAVKADEDLRDIQVLLLTTLSDPEDIFRALECGADNFVTKPANPDQLIGRIEFLIANRRVREDEGVKAGLEVNFAGNRQFIASGRLQILNLLLSTYDVAMQKNRELVKTSEELKVLTNELEEKVRDRTRHLETEVEQRRAAEAALWRQHTLSRLLERAAATANVSMDSDTALKQTVELVCRTLGWPVGYIFRIQAERDQPVIHATLRATYRAEKAGPRLEAGPEEEITVHEGQGLLGSVFASAEPHWIADIQADEAAMSELRQVCEDLHGSCAVPIVRGGEVVRVIAFCHCEVLSPDFEALAALKHVGLHLGHAMEREKAARDLSEHEKFLQAILDCATALVQVKDLNGRTITVNQAFESAFGINRQAIRGKRDTDFLDADLANRMRRYDEHVLETGEILELEEQAEVEGTTHSWILIKFPVRDGRGKIYAVGGHFTDITARKKAEEDRRLLATAADQAIVGLGLLDLQGILVYSNHTLDRLCQTNGAITREIRNVQVGHEEATDLSLQEVWQKVIQDRSVSYEGIFVHADSPEGEEAWRVQLSGINNENGVLTHYLLAVDELTEQRRLESQLRRSQRLESLGILAGGIAHDFNNILSAVIGYSDLAREDIADTALSLSHMDQVRNAGIRAQSLVKQILSFSRQRDGQFAPTRVDLVLDEALNFLRATLPSTIEIRTSVAPNCPKILADTTQLHQVFMNLCTNAAHAMAATGGVLEVVIEEFGPNGDADQIHPLLKPGRYLRVRVSDTGHGMDKEILNKVFEPFFTTKAPGSGTGLGLSVVHRIVRDHKGVITVYSELGKGTTFHIYLPVASDEEISGYTDPPVELPRGSEHILIVDDEEALANLMARRLSKYGYKTTVYTQSRLCLEAVRETPTEYKLLITDATMPDLSGMDLAQMVAEMNAALPVILVSGYHMNQSRENHPKNVMASLVKPTSDRDLLGTIRRVIDTGVAPTE